MKKMYRFVRLFFQEYPFVFSDFYCLSIRGGDFSLQGDFTSDLFGWCFFYFGPPDVVLGRFLVWQMGFIEITLGMPEYRY